MSDNSERVTFESYCGEIKYFYMRYSYYSEPLFDLKSTTGIVTAVRESYSRFEIREIYDRLRKIFIGLFYLRPDNDIRSLVRAFYELDTGCGVSDILSPEMSDDEKIHILEKLDADLIKFKSIYHEHIVKLTPDYKLIFEDFAKLLFKFNGYQGPKRLTLAESISDSIGSTDLFAELILNVDTKTQEEKKFNEEVEQLISSGQAIEVGTILVEFNPRA
jgi:hypothetical protein